jgi:hypothetical protein
MSEMARAESKPDEARVERRKALELAVEVPPEQSDERDLLRFANACLDLARSSDPSSRDLVRKAIPIIEPMRAENGDPAPRLAILAKAKRLLGDN